MPVEAPLIRARVHVRSPADATNAWAADSSRPMKSGGSPAATNTSSWSAAARAISDAAIFRRSTVGLPRGMRKAARSTSGRSARAMREICAMCSRTSTRPNAHCFPVR